MKLAIEGVEAGVGIVGMYRGGVRPKVLKNGPGAYFAFRAHSRISLTSVERGKYQRVAYQPLGEHHGQPWCAAHPAPYTLLRSLETDPPSLLSV